MNVGTGRNFTTTAVDAAYGDIPVSVDFGESILMAVFLYSGSAGAGNESTTKYVFEFNRPLPDPDLTDVEMTVNDTGSGNDVNYVATWTPNAAITNAAHDVRVRGGLAGGVQEAASTEASPATTTTETATDSGAGTGVSRDFWIAVDLLDSSGNQIKTWRQDLTPSTV